MRLISWWRVTYLLAVDYYSRWIEIAHLTQTTSSAIIQHLKSIFGRQGIPEVVISDNGPQYSSREFAKFGETYGFTHITSSPHYPKGNGEAERAVQTVKHLLRKAEDPYSAMLNYRATPLQQGYSPAELLNGRKLRTTIPTMSSHIPNHPDVDKFKEKDHQLKMKQKAYFDKRHRVKALSPMDQPDQPVWIKTPRVTEGSVVNSQPNPRSYILQTPTGNQRRNRHHLRKRSLQPSPGPGDIPRATSLLPAHAATENDVSPGSQLPPPPLPSTEEETKDTSTADAPTEVIRSRAGRIIKPREIWDM
ncbi:hypothetical protein V1264_005758 [Littorina saxatilis]|uniref:Integrase catalytic domain-containing protein n=1 Tax=Littorina saxatilis TaxID=31220 RepID=A0AAN9B0D2_9CAEN